MKINALKILVCAADTGSLRAAGRSLGLSQPAVTKTIREMERDLGAQLMVRANTGVVLTAQGKALYRHAQTVLQTLSLAKDEIDQLSGTMSGVISITAVPIAVLMLIPETLRTFSRAYPNVQVHINEALYLEDLTALRQDTTDIVISPIPSGLSYGEFESVLLMPVKMVVVCKKGSYYCHATHLNELIDAKWVFTSRLNGSGYAKQLFEVYGLTVPKPQAVVNSTLALCALVAKGDFVGLMPDSMAHTVLAKELISCIPVQEQGLELKIGALTKPQTALRPVVKQFLSHLQRAARHI